MTTTDTLEKASTAAPRPELDWERDWQGRPRILADPTWTPETAPPGWVVDGQVLPEREYTRMTTHAEALQDSSALTRWKMRRVLLGASRRPDYVTAAAALTAEERDKAALDDLAEKALEASGPNAAEVGTALHGFTERIDRGEDVGVVPPEYQATLDAYRHATSVLTFVEWECRTVCDELEAAGTPDRMGFCSIPDPDGVVDELRVIDTKTGRVDYSAGKFSTQLAGYRRSRLYHPGTGVRTTWEEKHGHPVSRWGLVVHVPAGAGAAELLWLELDHGSRGGDLASEVRAWRKGATSGRLLRPVFARAPRPATTDGTCRGRKQDGQPCGYRRKAKDPDPVLAQFCGRHQEQAAQLERWWSENPDMDPNAGVEAAPSMTPVQPSSPALGTPDAQVAQDAAQDAQDDQLQQQLEQSLAARGVKPAGMRPHYYASSVAGDSFRGHCLNCGLERAHPEALHIGVTVAGGDMAEQAMAGAQAASAVVAEQQRPLPELPGLAQMQQAVNTTPEEAEAFVAKARELGQEPVGTYALDPDRELNGNPRPVAGLQSPEDVARAAGAAAAMVGRQLEVARSESELQLVYQQNAHRWTPWLTDLAAKRSAQLREEQARARPEAALLAALETAPTEAMLTTLWTEYGGTSLWTSECTTLATRRLEQLRAAALL